ncbi:MAG: chemotaxis-specific protein-glutamate methyltransferase CheB [Caulobacteraceae bacterium]|nr:chemotaxis-specific protein-glutamate methyltransferase CheB [Caulobacteraceae bacterium]
MVVDDSAVVRGLLTKYVDEQPDMAMVGRAGNGAAALMELDRVKPDVILLDVEMPEMDGLTALPLILRKVPGVRVLMVSGVTRKGASETLKALSAGATDFLPKPEGGAVRAEEFGRDLVAKIRAVGRPRQAANSGARTAPAAAPASGAQRQGQPAHVLLIGASTGGPPVILDVLSRLGGLRTPVLVTQHMPATFTTLLAEQIARASGRPTAEARDGEAVQAGRIYVAPGGWHMTVSRGVSGAPILRLDQGPAVHWCRPAVDPMITSAAAVYGAAAAAVILTGMGQDGADGCRALARAGGRFAVQDEESSAVWGMPGAAYATGMAAAKLSIPEISGWLVGCAEGRHAA